MITVRKADQRHTDSRRKREVWRTFVPADRADPLADGFGTLESFTECRLRPGGRVPGKPHRDAEIITYVREGALAFEDSRGHAGIIQTGEFQLMTVGSNLSPGASNPSRTIRAQVFQLWLRPSQAGHQASYAKARFSAAQRRGGLCLVASRDGRRGSLRIRQDARMFSAILESGHHVVHELAPGRSAWLHVVQGEVSVGDVVLGTGDSAGVTTDRAVSFTARADTEILLVDVGDR